MMDLIVRHAPVIGLLFFFTVFCVVAFQTYRPKNRKTIQSHAFIPLKED